jgi:hypothetical protein
MTKKSKFFGCARVTILWQTARRGHFKVGVLWSWEVKFRFLKIF